MCLFMSFFLLSCFFSVQSSLGIARKITQFRKFIAHFSSQYKSIILLPLCDYVRGSQMHFALQFQSKCFKLVQRASGRARKESILHLNIKRFKIAKCQHWKCRGWKEKTWKCDSIPWFLKSSQIGPFFLDCSLGGALQSLMKIAC